MATLDVALRLGSFPVFEGPGELADETDVTTWSVTIVVDLRTAAELETYRVTRQELRLETGRGTTRVVVRDLRMRLPDGPYVARLRGSAVSPAPQEPPGAGHARPDR